jgi:hypothetical protein
MYYYSVHFSLFIFFLNCLLSKMMMKKMMQKKKKMMMPMGNVL